jgi:hypothetical protein
MTRRPTGDTIITWDLMDQKRHVIGTFKNGVLTKFSD